MNKKLLKQLIISSYTGNNLNQEMAFAIADKLDRTDLKLYIKALKHMEKKQSVMIALAQEATTEQEKQLQSLFPNKKIILSHDPSLLTGLRITNNDDIFEMNLKDRLDDIMNYVN